MVHLVLLTANVSDNASGVSNNASGVFGDAYGVSDADAGTGVRKSPRMRGRI
jgi:hypothetical protein